MTNHIIKENEFFPAPGGMAGSINTQPGYGTFASPLVSQNPNSFASSNNNKAVGQQGNTAKEVPDSGSMERDLNTLYSKKDTPTPDEVVTGIKYELHNQIKKDRRKAKEMVLQNLKKDPHYYGKLKMLNITDKDMVDNMQESKRHPNDRPAPRDKFTPNIEETRKIFSEMTKGKDKTFVVNQGIVDVMRQLWEEKRNRSSWKTAPKQ